MVLHKKITTRTTIILRVVVQCLTGRIAGCQVGSSNPSQWNLKNGISCQTNLARVKGVVQLHRHKMTDETFDRSCQNCFNTKFTKLLVLRILKTYHKLIKCSSSCLHHINSLPSCADVWLTLQDVCLSVIRVTTNCLI